MTVPRWLDGLLDLIACLIFPSRKYLTATLVAYAIAIAVGLWWWSGNPLWIPATALCMVFAAMLIEWFF